MLRAERIWGGLLRLLGFVVGAAFVVCLGLLLLGTARVLLYEQEDDAEHLAAKRAYLAAMPELSQEHAPNLVLILFDDLGYGDLGTTGSRSIATPEIDRLAREGLRLTNYSSPAPNCTPSRAAMLTGRYAPHTSLTLIVFPDDSPLTWTAKLMDAPIRLPAEEITLADVLGAAGYRTFMAGKWHLGNNHPSRPIDMGFEHWLGVLYSNDMQPLALWRDEEVIETAPVDQSRLTEKYTQAAIEFLEQTKGEPFFLYVAHTFPHIPLFPSAAHAGESAGGVYGDVVEDLDRSVGRILEALDRLELTDDTIVFVTSDNGPWFQGSSGANIRGRKNSTFRGGQRVPAIVRWPNRISGGVSDAMAMGIDLLPTMLELLDLPQPADRDLDGRSLAAVLLEDAPSPHAALYAYAAGDLFALQGGRWRYRLRKGVELGSIGGLPFLPLVDRGPWLFDLELDPDESYDVSTRHPEVFARFAALAETQLALDESNPRRWR